MISYSRFRLYVYLYTNLSSKCWLFTHLKLFRQVLTDEGWQYAQLFHFYTFKLTPFQHRIVQYSYLTMKVGRLSSSWHNTNNSKFSAVFTLLNWRSGVRTPVLHRTPCDRYILDAKGSERIQSGNCEESVFSVDYSSRSAIIVEENIEHLKNKTKSE